MALAVIGLLPGCSSSSGFSAADNIGGTYTVSVTNKANDCMLENWTVGNSSAGIPFVIDQQEANVTGTLQQGAGVLLFLFIGSNVFHGTATGASFSMTAYGTVMRQLGSCSDTMNATINGTISGDAITGTIEYSPAPTSNPDCASVQCSSTQDFNGTRPPT